MYSKRSRPSRLVAAQTLMTSLSLIRIPIVVTTTREPPRYTQGLSRYTDNIDVSRSLYRSVYPCVPDTRLPARPADLAPETLSNQIILKRHANIITRSPLSIFILIVAKISFFLNYHKPILRSIVTFGRVHTAFCHLYF